MTAFVPESIRIIGTDGGGLSVVLCSMYVDTLADLPTPTAYTGFRLSMGCTAIVINDNSIHRINSAGQWVDITENDGKYTLPPATSNSLGGIMVGSGLTIDSAGILSGDFSALWDSIYQTEKHLTGVPPLSFMASGNGIEAAVIYGNGQQQGTAAPGNPVMPTFCGTLDGTDWKIPLTCAGQTVPVYLGQTQTVRRIKKLVLTGEETIPNNDGASYNSETSTDRFVRDIPLSVGDNGISEIILCTHLGFQAQSWAARTKTGCCIYCSGNTMQLHLRIDNTTLGITQSDTNEQRTEKLKAYLSAQYAAGTPVTVWYVLAGPETAIVNEPLCKIGDYADELSSTDAGISIQTVRGQNTLTIGTTLQPSKISITYF